MHCVAGRTCRGGLHHGHVIILVIGIDLLTRLIPEHEVDVRTVVVADTDQDVWHAAIENDAEVLRALVIERPGMGFASQRVAVGAEHVSGCPQLILHLLLPLALRSRLAGEQEPGSQE